MALADGCFQMRREEIWNFARRLERERDEAVAAIKEAYPELVNTPRPAYARRALERVYKP